MNDYFSRFHAAPTTFKKSFTMLVVAWACHPIFIYSLFWSNDAVAGSDKDIVKMAIVSLCLIFLLFLIKKWARALVVVGSLFIVINDFFYFFVIPQNTISTLLCVTVILFMMVGTYWLFVKETRDYFTRVNPKNEASGPPDENVRPTRSR